MEVYLVHAFDEGNRFYIFGIFSTKERAEEVAQEKAALSQFTQVWVDTWELGSCWSTHSKRIENLQADSSNA